MFNWWSSTTHRDIYVPTKLLSFTRIINKQLKKGHRAAIHAIPPAIIGSEAYSFNEDYFIPCPYTHALVGCT